MLTAEDLAKMMAIDGVCSEIQLRQTRFRMRLVDEWQIAEGARVLEVGCGQGDTTAVLAAAVGPSGHVTAVDAAGAGYGSPVSIGDSTNHLKQGPLGDWIEFILNFDALDPSIDFHEDQFDFIVMAHCTWYFDSMFGLGKTLRRLRPLAPKLCLSEWDLQPRSMAQIAHLLAVLIQGQIEAYKTNSQANVRTPYSRQSIGPILVETGWEIRSDTTIEADDLDDAKWEIEMCLANAGREADVLDLPRKVRDLLESQVDVLRQIWTSENCRPLNSYAMVAQRKSGN